MILKNCTFFNELFEKEFGDIKIEKGKISEIGYFSENGRDMSGKIILPGFIDIHIHGGNGGDCSDGTSESLDKVSTYLVKHGVTSFCPTTMTLPIDRLTKIADTIANFKSKGAKIAGINFEGPFIAMSKKGAQNGDYVIPGTCKDFNDLYDASGGMMKIITIAPEAFESDEFIENAAHQCTVSIGHTAADSKECQRAIDFGARHITHLYNAMTAMTHREAGVAGTALDNDNVTCELICDGEHICPAVLRNTFDILGEDRAVVISDSMRGAGLGNGEFELGGQTTYVKDGYKVAKLADGTIAASITNVFDEFKNLLAFGIDVKAALKACTINPARVIKEDNQIGSIAVGKCADIIITDENLEIEEVYINGILA
ncbi:MAG: N-acetylglucosamine-6-phosphate deacetylase [Eubacterium sp.]